jgi:hypothetical protein
MTVKQNVGNQAPDGSIYVVLTDGAGNLGSAITATSTENLAQLAGTAIDVNSGVKSAGTQRVVLATDQPNFTTAMNVNNSQVAGVTVDTNSGNKSAGTQRVVLATDQPNFTTPFNINNSQINGVTPLMGNGATGTGAMRVSIANDSTGIVALPAAGTSIVGTTAAGTAGATSALVGGVYSSTIPALTTGQQIARQVDPAGSMYVNTEIRKNAYAQSSQIATAASATDVHTLLGSASKLIKIKKVILYGNATTAANFTFSLRRYTGGAYSGGTGSTPTPAILAGSTAATGVIKSFTANPTIGAGTINVIGTYFLFFNTTASTVQQAPLVLDFSLHPIVLNGTSEYFAVNLVGQTVTGGSITSNIEWTEE